MNELDKTYFQHDMAYEDFKYLTRRTTSDKILRDKVFNVAKNLKYDRYKRVHFKKSALFAWSETLATSDKSASSSAVKIENITRQKLPEELHKPIIRKFENRKVDS